MYEQAHCHDNSCQLPVTHSCGLMSHPNSFCGGMFSLTQNLMQICCSVCSVILNVTATQCSFQWHLPTPPTSTVKSSLFTHAPSRPPSLAARLHRCRTNRSRYINSGWTFSGQPLYSFCEVFSSVVHLLFILCFFLPFSLHPQKLLKYVSR